MTRRIVPVSALTIVMTLALAACGGTAASSTPAGSSAPPASSGGPAASSGGPVAGACQRSSTAGTVTVSMKDFAFAPADISARVGDTITFTNGDSTAHTASLVDGSCTTPNIEAGKSDGLTFSAAGSYPFRCNIHQTMQGTIVVS